MLSTIDMNSFNVLSSIEKDVLTIDDYFSFANKIHNRYLIVFVLQRIILVQPIR